MSDFHIEQMPIGQLQPHKRNPRTHSRKQVQQIAASIKAFGFNNPVLVDRHGEILAGHGRVEAANMLGLKSVPVIRIQHLSEEQKRAYLIADNKIALNAGWNAEMLAVDLKELATCDLSFELEVTGFDTEELQVLVTAPIKKSKIDACDAIPGIGSVAVAKTGDLWILGEHRLLCADARDRQSYSVLLGEDRARLVFTDVPGKFSTDGHTGGRGSGENPGFAMSRDLISEAASIDLLTGCFRRIAQVSADGATHFLAADWRHVAEVLAAGKAIYSQLVDLAVWTKKGAGMGTLYRSMHELICVFTVGSAAHLNTAGRSRNTRYRSNVWDYAAVTPSSSASKQDAEIRRASKPVALVRHAIEDCSRSGEIVLDPFSGSGTTIIAAHQSGRRARAIEINPVHADVAIRRWQTLTRASARLATTGDTFDHIAAGRR